MHASSLAVTVDASAKAAISMEARWTDDELCIADLPDTLFEVMAASVHELDGIYRVCSEALHLVVSRWLMLLR